ncbi:MAG: acyl-CoA thioester hydrolase/BAAT C-terminal domain-containing protein [Solirubrobacteraceae bacterium]
MAPVDLMTNPGMFASKRALSAWPFGMHSGYVNAYSWHTCSTSAHEQHDCSWSGPRSFVFTAISGRSRASVTVRRGPALPVTATVETIAKTGFYGVYWRPPASRDTHIGIVEFGGSGGGIDSSFGAVLASHGYPTLDVAYIGEPGLHRAVEDVHLEYFAQALGWLERQPGVDPNRVWVMGWSLGSEAALLLGIHYPDLVHGVVALEPSDVPLCSWVAPAAGPPIWTFDGQPVPCANQTNPLPAQNLAAVIPVSEIPGPVLLDCGAADGIWSACEYAQTMMAELSAGGDPHPHELLDYPAAGHGLGAPVPYTPGAATLEEHFQLGGQTAVANAIAVANQWPKLLAFLRR